MWKKLALLVAIASAVTQAVRYWNDASTKTTAQRKREARHAVQRWEDEGGNLRPEPSATSAPKSSSRPRRSANNGGRSSGPSASASA